MEKLDEFIMVGKDLYMLGLVDSHGGSLSIRTGDRIFITRKNAMLGHLKEEDILEAPLEGGSATDEAASRELPVHRAIYKETGFNAIVHATPLYAVALSVPADNRINPIDSKGQLMLRGIPVVRTKDKIGSEEVAKLLPPIFKSGYQVAIIKEYGSFAVGASLLDALHYTTCLESSCKIIAVNKMLVAREVRKEPEKERRTAIPPGIGVMGRSRYSKRGFGR